MGVGLCGFIVLSSLATQKADRYRSPSIQGFVLRLVLSVILVGALALGQLTRETPSLAAAVILGGLMSLVPAIGVTGRFLKVRDFRGGLKRGSIVLLGSMGASGMLFMLR